MKTFSDASDTGYSYVLDVKGNVLKKEKDFSLQVETAVLGSFNLLNNNKFDEAIECLLVAEKATRIGADLSSYLAILTEIIGAYARFEYWDKLIEMMVVLSKRRGQFKEAIVELVQNCYTYVDKITDKEIRTQLMKTIVQISESKIYVENERARLLILLALEAETDGRLNDAISYIKDLNVECYGIMSPLEKTDIMLEQIRLFIEADEVIRAQIISKRINPSFIRVTDSEIMKCKYYKNLLHLKFVEEEYLEAAQLGVAFIYLPLVDCDVNLFYAIFEAAFISLFLCPLAPARAELTKKIQAHKNYIEMSTFRKILENCVSFEIFNWTKFQTTYGEKLYQIFAPERFAFSPSHEHSKKMFSLFKKRIIERDLLVIYQSYSQMSITRLGELLDMSEEDVEDALRKGVTDNVIFARINRPKRIVVFLPQKSNSTILDDYIDRMSSLLSNIDNVATLINKEYNQIRPVA